MQERKAASVPLRRPVAEATFAPETDKGSLTIMFQTFDDIADPSLARDRVARLRARFDKLGIDGFIVPRADEHQGEYVPAAAERLKWLTGFSGSAGSALILRDLAVIFVDGRYALQVREQTDGSLFAYENLVERPPARWLAEQKGGALRIGFDPWLHTIRDAENLRNALERAGGALVAIDRNPVDAIWRSRPAPPLGEVTPHPRRFAGESTGGKLARLSRSVAHSGASHFVLTDPASIAWAFNIRGRDVPHTPLPLAFAILAANGDHRLFIDERKLPQRTARRLKSHCAVRRHSLLPSSLARLAESGAVIGLDPQGAAEKLRMIVESAGGKSLMTTDPVALPRAIKNPAEIAGSRDAHRRDGAAVTRFLHWLDRQAPGTIDEIGAAVRLEELRRLVGDEMQMPLRDISFDTISGAGPNGAVIHYRVTTATNRRLEAGMLYLVDSGGQYADGTTDITRTVPIGRASGEMRRHYTIVLKGLIGISMLRFPPGTRGMDIDAVARIAHWKAGLDYAHGTGHGVGSFLSVHEGPQRLSRTGTEKLVPGMILSNEPGYYREGQYGIRLENLVLVTGPGPIDGGEIDMLGFETLTLAPFDRRLIAPEMLVAEERGWLDAYHQGVLREIGPLLDVEAREWLALACAPL
jgi:Xaa-Pro aminopeptidase